MAVFSHIAQPTGDSFQTFRDFTQRPSIRNDDKRSRPLTDAQRERERLAQEYEEEWKESIKLARWEIDLGEWTTHPQSADALHPPAKRSLDGPSEFEPSTKKPRLSDGRIPDKAQGGNNLASNARRLDGISILEIRPCREDRNPAWVNGKKVKATKRGGPPPPKPVNWTVSIANGPELKHENFVFNLDFHDSDHERWIRALDLLRPAADPRCRARCTGHFDVVDSNATSRLKLIVELQWKNASSLDDTLSGTRNETKIHAANYLLEQLFPGRASRDTVTNNFSPRLFYDHVHVPAFDPTDAKTELDVPGLQTGLYAFQKRTLRWMLRREKSPLTGNSKQLCNGFERVVTVDGRECFYNPWLQLFTTDEYLCHDTIGQLRGGILAEEMGLGKTVELMSLIQLHQRHEHDAGEHDGLHRSPATLVVAPRAIMAQWQSEIETHCPSLSVMVYQGLAVSAQKKTSDYKTDEQLLAYLLSHDVVLVDYDVLQKEINYTTEAPDRSRRREVVYERRKSPLILIDWWRVILDEAQTIESGITKAAQVVYQIPRQNAWAVSGTPLRKDPSDLFALMRFLRIEPHGYSDKLFYSLISNHQELFVDLVRRISLRHTKEFVKADLQLPPQKRVVINVPFTAIEEQNYNQLFESMVTECGLNLDGSPATDDWSPKDPTTVAKMRAWLAQLRQVCLHPDVGGHGRRTGAGRDAPLRTVNEVLAVMTESNDADLRVEERSRLQSMLRRGQILEADKQPLAARQIWQQVLDEISKVVAEDRKALDVEVQRAKQLQDQHKPVAENDEGDDNAAVSKLRNRLRVALEVQHSTIFFIANAIYQIKTDESMTRPESDRFKELEELEASRYEEAKMLRRELLSTAAEQAKGFIERIRTRISKDDFVQLKGMKALSRAGGIETRKFVDQLEDMAEVLNAQTELLDGWRAELAEAVLVPLVDQEDKELTGEEYENSTKQEDTIHAYMEAVRLLIADRAQILTGQRNQNVRREATRLLHEAAGGEGHAPELMKKLLLQANMLRTEETREGDIKVWLRGTIQQLVQLRGTLEARSGRAGEVAIIDKALSDIRPQTTDAIKTVAALEKELDLFSDTVNARVDYYRQLQVISDLVAPFEEELSDTARANRLRRMEEAEAQHVQKATRLRKRANFFKHLKSDAQSEQVERVCVICTDSFQNGVLTSCGHVYCAECIRHWWGSHRTCPQCKQTLGKTDLHAITYKPLQLSVQEEPESRSPSFDAKQPEGQAADPTLSIYTGIEQTALDEIRSIDLRRSYGTKIDMLARHILWLRDKEPGAKSVVFSQFRDFFDVLEGAFDRFNIGWRSLTDGSRAVQDFKKDSKVEVLLLHAKAQASGLNLVNATHVFLCEPLINTAIELQVIARVHRIGQHSPTTVWQYLVENTVEKAIYDLSVERRLSHIQTSRAAKRSRSAGLGGGTFEAEVDAANSVEIEAPAGNLLAKGRSGGEQVATEDLWPALFKYRPLGQEGAPQAVRQATALFLAGEAAEQRLAVRSA